MTSLFGVSAAELARARGEAVAAPEAPARRTLWTADEDASLRALWPTGGCSVAAAVLGRSIAAVGSRARRLGLRSPNGGLVSLTDVARLAGCSRDRVRRAALVAGIPRLAFALGHAHRAAPRRLGLPAEGARQLVKSLASAPERITKNRKGLWGVGRKPDACRGPGCRHPGAPHRALGRCSACHQRAVRYGGTARAPSVEGLSPAERDVVLALSRARSPLGVRAIAEKTGRFREQIGRVVRSLILAGRVALAPGQRKCLPRYTLAPQGAPCPS